VGPVVTGAFDKDVWSLNPNLWHSHPAIVPLGFIAAVILLLVLGVAFWIKGRFWP
jgi:hypothetical protein